MFGWKLVRDKKKEVVEEKVEETKTDEPVVVVDYVEDQEPPGPPQVENVVEQPWPKPLYALVQLQVQEIMNTKEVDLIRRLLLMAVGAEDLGKIDVKDFAWRPVGVVNLNIVFEITGTLHRPEDKPKAKPKTTRKKTTTKRKTTSKRKTPAKKTTRRTTRKKK